MACPVGSRKTREITAAAAARIALICWGRGRSRRQSGQFSSGKSADMEEKGSISQVACSAVALHLTHGLFGKEGERASLDHSLEGREGIQF